MPVNSANSRESCPQAKQMMTWLEKDTQRMAALKQVEALFALYPQRDWLISAGFVRNLVWDRLHNIKTELNDIDVIYYDPQHLDEAIDIKLEADLKAHLPLNWSVKNQARMHVRNHDSPYLSCLDAMSYWPEKQTAIGVKLQDGQLEIVSAFELNGLFDFTLTHNPKRVKTVFNSRVANKGWLQTYPKLKLIS